MTHDETVTHFQLLTVSIVRCEQIRVASFSPNKTNHSRQVRNLPGLNRAGEEKFVVIVIFSLLFFGKSVIMDVSIVCIQ